uniref:Uncharacterized protein n=1 Tax=Amphimedon queenslandica TaxID=400682 RepID=A0A1X7T2Y9_AMPQE
MSWTQLHPNDESMMKKGYGGMLSLEFEGTDYLFIVGGVGTTPAVNHPQFQYSRIKDGRVSTNEQLLYNLSNGQFTVPSVSGQCCPPNSEFTINKVNQNKGIMFGGLVINDDGLPTVTNNVYIFNVTHNIIHWESIKKGSISGERLWTKERYDHASAIINGDSTSPALVVIGGRDNNNQVVTKCLLFDNITTGHFSCKKIPLPEFVTGRYFHSLTAVTMSPHCVWLVIVGGYKKLEWIDVGVGEDTNRLIMIIELVYIEAGEWIVQSVLDGNDLTSKKYQEKSLQRNPPPPPSTDPTTPSSSSNVVHESTSVSSTGGASPSATVDVNKVKKVIEDVLVSHYAALNSLPKKSLTGLVNQLYTAKLISNEVREAPSMEECIDEFKSSLSFKRKLPKVEEHCQKFLNSFIAVRGSYADAAEALGEDWIEALQNELGLDFNISIDD